MASVTADLRNGRQFVRFGLVGLFNTGFDFAVFLFLAQAMHWDQVLAQAVAYLCGMFSSYLGNRFFTFARRDQFRYQEVLKFAVLNAFSLGLSALGIGLVQNMAGPVILGKAGVTAVTVLINFVGNKRWVFARREAGRKYVST